MEDQKVNLLEQMHFIEQFAESVIDYTSRYNSAMSISYAPENIIGKPTKYPCYGDFPETYMLRSYGKWYIESGGAQKDYMPQDRDPIVSEDYIIVKFEQAVIATRIIIYETYNPGAVVRIWGGKGRGFWTLLWQGAPQSCTRESPCKAVPFAPKIRVVQDLIHLIRIEFNQSQRDYHTALDAILLAGYKPKTTLVGNLIRNGLMDIKPPQKKKREKLNDTNENNEECLFLKLPLEVIVYIFGFLDLKSLCYCANVNKTFRSASNATLLYRDLSLKRYWNKVCDRTLQYFEPKCKILKKLDLSWCGSDNKITEDCFTRFLKNCGQHLTHLSLGKCDFIQARALETITKCPELTDLRLRNIHVRGSDCFLILAELNKLKSLDLYSSNIDDQSLLKIIKNNRGLEHLIVDLCEKLIELDLITETIASYNKNLRTFSAWKIHSLTPEGIKSLSKCNELRELDLGWCLILSDPVDCLTHVAQGCPNLQRLILAGWRGVGDHQLLPIIRNCSKMQQLDLMGTRGITENLCEMALRTFHDLKLLDVSFCDLVTTRQVKEWRLNFPNIVIQMNCSTSAPFIVE